MLVLALLCGGWPQPVLAAMAGGLYESAVLVTARDDAARQDGLLRALHGVLVKLTGRRQVSVDQVMPDASVPIEGLVEQFQFRDRGADGSTELWVRFDAAAVDALLDQAGVQRWPRTRPLTAMLIGLDSGGRRQVLAATDSSGLAASLLAAARERGLPIVLPLMDLRDQRAIGPADLWGGFTDRLHDAAGRYGAEAIVYARLRAAATDVWDADWTLLSAGEAHSWQRQGLAGAVLAEALVDSVVERLAGAFNAPSGGAGDSGASLAMVVTGIDSAASYGRVLRYLRGLDLVERVDVRGVGGGRADLVVHGRGGADALRRLIAIGNTLVPDPASAAASDPTAAAYRLVP